MNCDAVGIGHDYLQTRIAAESLDDFLELISIASYLAKLQV
jgi:hypothetical protein